MSGSHFAELLSRAKNCARKEIEKYSSRNNKVKYCLDKKGYWDELWRLLQFNKLSFPNYHETPCGLSPRASTFDVRPVLKCP